MPAIRWIRYTERVVAQDHPSLADVANRPLKDLLTNSGVALDDPNPRFMIPGAIDWDDIAGISPTFILISADPSVPSARTLVGGIGVTLTDAGAGSTLTIDMDAEDGYSLVFGSGTTNNPEVGEGHGVPMPWPGVVTGWWVGTVYGTSGTIAFDVKRESTSMVGTGTKPFLTADDKNSGDVSDWDLVVFSEGDRVTGHVDGTPSGTLGETALVLQVRRTA